MSDFSGDDYEFAAGAIYGMRSWGIDELGRLHGVTHAEVWTPGENVAKCKAKREIPCPNPVAPRDHLPAQPESTPKPKKKRGRRDPSWEIMAPWEREILYGTQSGLRARCGDPSCYRGVHIVDSGHDFDANCQCGFWAYDEHTFSAHGDVTGIIEGYGKTTIGTRGFRSEKARVAALCRKRDGGGRISLSMWMRLQQLYPEAKFFETVDEMVTNFGAVMHSWPAVADDFWTQPVKRKDDEYTFSVGGYSMTSYSRAMAKALNSGIYVSRP